jgi:hypothetical protein
MRGMINTKWSFVALILRTNHCWTLTKKKKKENHWTVLEALRLFSGM